MSKAVLVFVAIVASCFVGCSSGDDQAPDLSPTAGSGGQGGSSGAGAGAGGTSGEGGEGGDGPVGGASGASGAGGVGGASGVGGAGGTGGIGGDSGMGGEGGGGGGMDCDGEADGDTQQRVRYAQAEVEAVEDCLSEAQARSCEDGAWSAWSGSYAAETCTVVAESCDGMEENRTRYEAEEVAYGEECESETQTAPCDDGELGEWTGTFTFESCEPEPGLPCGDLPDGESNTRTRYATATVPYGEACDDEVQMQTCTNGALGDWTGTFTIEACEVDDPIDCTGGAHGEMHMRTRYQSATVAWGTSCVSEVQNETCDNGEWLDWTGTYTFEACVVSDPMDCTGGAHGTSQTRTRYLAATVPNGSTCQSEVQTSLCTNGVWGAYSGTYTFDDCDVLPPFAGSCTLTNAGTAYACLDVIGTAYTPAGAMAACPAPYIYSAGHCAEGATLLGTCVVPLPATFEQVQYYYESPVFSSAASAEQDCTGRSGAWTAR